MVVESILLENDVFLNILITSIYNFKFWSPQDAVEFYFKSTKHVVQSIYICTVAHSQSDATVKEILKEILPEN